MSLQKPSLQKMLSNARELSAAELAEVSGGGAEPTVTCYTDSGGTKHCVRNYDE